MRAREEPGYYNPKDKDLFHNKKDLYSPDHMIAFEYGIPDNEFLYKNGFRIEGVGHNYPGSMLAYVMYYTFRPAIKVNENGVRDYYFSVPDLKKIL